MSELRSNPRLSKWEVRLTLSVCSMKCQYIYRYLFQVLLHLNPETYSGWDILVKYRLPEVSGDGTKQWLNYHQTCYDGTLGQNYFSLNGQFFLYNPFFI